MTVLAIDPGDVRSAWVLYHDGEILDKGLEPNHVVLDGLFHRSVGENAPHLAIEMIASYGMPVGKTVFETCVWIGRFIQEWGGPFTLVYRSEVKMHLCGNTRAKDGNVRQALLDRFGPPGTKKEPGITYGVSKDIWSALAVAVTWADTKAV